MARAIATYFFGTFQHSLIIIHSHVFLQELIVAVDKISSHKFSFQKLLWLNTIHNSVWIFQFFAQRNWFTHITELNNNPLKLQVSQDKSWAV